MSAQDSASSREGSPQLGPLSVGKRTNLRKSILKEPSPKISPRFILRGPRSNSSLPQLPDIPQEDFAASRLYQVPGISVKLKKGPQWERLQQIKEMHESSSDSFGTPRFEGRAAGKGSRHTSSMWLKPVAPDEDADSQSTQNRPGAVVETENLPLDEASEFQDDQRFEDARAVDFVAKLFELKEIKSLIRNSKTLEFLDVRNGGASATSFRASRKSLGLQSGLLSKNSATSIEGKSSMKSTNRLNKLKVFSSADKLEHWLSYLTVAFFLAQHFSQKNHVESLLPYVRRMFKDLPSAGPAAILQIPIFCKELLNVLCELGEVEILRLFFSTQIDLQNMLTPETRDIFVKHSRLDYMMMLLESFDEQLASKKIKTGSIKMRDLVSLNSNCEEITFDPTPGNGGTPQESGSTIPEVPIRHADTKLQTLRELVNFLMTTVFMCTEENSLLIQLLQHLGLSTCTILELLIEKQQAARIILISKQLPKITENLTRKMVLEAQQYTLLILFDKMELIEVFNEVVKHPETRENTTLFHELCYHIESGVMVEGYCNVVTKISETFWDLPKLMIFFNALQALVFSKKGNWLAYIRNPLLFFITLVKFFKDMKSQLDYRDNNINKLTEALVAFCQIYIEALDQESFLLNVFDFDGNNKGILDYAFEVANMDLLESEPVEDLVERLWDLHRHTMQSFGDFNRLAAVRNQSAGRFSWRLYRETFDVTIEPDDVFQLDFQFASNSNLMRILSEIFWPGLNFLIELVFSVFITELKVMDRFDSSSFFGEYRNYLPWLADLHLCSRVSFLISIAIKTLVIKHMAGGFNYMAKFFNTMLFIAFLQMVIYPLFLWKDGNFMFLNITQMLFVMANFAYVCYNALALNQVGVYMRIFFRMTFVVLIFGTLSCVIITIIAYPIHTLYINFTQQIEGQIYDDMNLFSSWYQGIATLFEFTFGAVVFVRPYQEQNTYTYTLTFVMIIFSFFGNIMLANLLVAFLTSQFDEINRNAKYLTLNLQHQVIKAFRVEDCDGILTLPFPLMIPALPVMAFMLPRGPRRARCNLFLRKVIHVLNVFVPAFVFLNIKMAVDMLLQYLLIALDLFSAGFSAPINFAYLLSWIALGPFFLLKLFLLDNLTVCSRILDFSNSGETLTQYDLGDEARTNLVHTFNMMNRVVHHEIEIKGKKKLTVRSFLSKMHSHSIQEFVVRRLTVGLSRQVNGVKGIINKKSIKDEPQTAGESINMKYGKHDVDHSPQILERFVSSVGQDEWPLFLDLEFMKEKFKNNINIMNVHSLLGFDKSALDKASEVFTQDSEIEIHEQAAECNRALINLDERVDILTGKSTTVLDMLVQLDAAIPTPSDPNT